MLDLRSRPLLAALALSLSLSACASEVRDEAAFPPSAPAAPTAASEGDLFTVSADTAADVDITVGAEAAPRFDCDPQVLAHLHVEPTPAGIRVYEDEDADWPDNARCTVHLALPSVQAVAAAGSGDVRVHGQAAELARIDRSGSGDVTVDDLAAPGARVDVSGSGSVTLTHAAVTSLSFSVSGAGSARAAGTAERLQVAVSGSGGVDTRGLRASDAMVSISGSGDAMVHASRSVAASVLGSGDVTVAGQPPQRSVSSLGSGSVAFE